MLTSRYNVDINISNIQSTPMTAHTPLETAIHIRDTCLCFATQRAARLLARRFDRALAGVGITNNQFSLMVRLSAGDGPAVTQLAPQLAMDRTTLTAALKALEKPGLIALVADDKDRRIRRARLTDAGWKVLDAAIPIWRREHAALTTALPGGDCAGAQGTLAAIAHAALQVAPE